LEIRSAEEAIYDGRKLLGGSLFPGQNIFVCNPREAGSQKICKISPIALRLASAELGAGKKRIKQALLHAVDNAVLYEQLQKILLLMNVAAESQTDGMQAAVVSLAAAGGGLEDAVGFQRIADDVFFGVKKRIKGLPGNMGMAAELTNRDIGVRLFLQKNNHCVGDLPLGSVCNFISSAIHGRSSEKF
jgi:hypothetical protein